VICLPDVNVLVALAWPRHVHHEAAHAWFAREGKDGWATCPMTQCGFVRVLSNKAIVADAVAPAGAVAMLARMTSVPGHTFWPDEVPLCDVQCAPARFLTGHRQVTDYYLLGLAVRKGGRFVTLDRGVLSLLPQNSGLRESVHLIEV